MKTIYLDIETIPTDLQPVIAHIRSKLKPPANYSNPETIAKWHADPKHLAKALHDTGLSGKFGRIACVGLCGDIGEVTILSGDEKQMLVDLRQILASYDDSNTADGVRIVGHNVISFDLAFLSQRMMVHGLGPLIPFGAKPWDLNVGDTMTMFMSTTREFISLSDLCMALGVEQAPNPIDGSQVAEFWQAGDQETVFKHCAADLVSTRRCYQHMMRIDPEKTGHALSLTDHTTEADTLPTGTATHHTAAEAVA